MTLIKWNSFSLSHSISMFSDVSPSIKSFETDNFKYNSSSLYRNFRNTLFNNYEITRRLLFLPGCQTTIWYTYKKNQLFFFFFFLANFPKIVATANLLRKYFSKIIPFPDENNLKIQGFCYHVERLEFFFFMQ